MISLNKLPLGQMMLGLVVLGIIGLLAELLLLDHIESFNQWIPLISLGIGLFATIAVWLKPTRTTLLVFKASMAAFVAAGLLGVYFHFAGNVEWAQERDPDLRGLPLVWKALKGAVPSLAPGALAQLGLLGLIFAWSRSSTNDTDNK